MKQKSTQFNFINLQKGPWDESEEWDAIMEESETLFSQEELKEEFTPSDQAVQNILNFARSYQTVPSRNLRFIDLYMN